MLQLSSYGTNTIRTVHFVFCLPFRNTHDANFDPPPDVLSADVGEFCSAFRPSTGRCSKTLYSIEHPVSRHCTAVTDEYVDVVLSVGATNACGEMEV
jgi:hypothetical protein